MSLTSLTYTEYEERVRQLVDETRRNVSNPDWMPMWKRIGECLSQELNFRYVGHGHCIGAGDAEWLLSILPGETKSIVDSYLPLNKGPSYERNMGTSQQRVQWSRKHNKPESDVSSDASGDEDEEQQPAEKKFKESVESAESAESQSGSEIKEIKEIKEKTSENPVSPELTPTVTTVGATLPSITYHIHRSADTIADVILVGIAADLAACNESMALTLAHNINNMASGSTVVVTLHHDFDRLREMAMERRDRTFDVVMSETEFRVQFKKKNCRFMGLLHEVRRPASPSVLDDTMFSVGFRARKALNIGSLLSGVPNTSDAPRQGQMHPYTRHWPFALRATVWSRNTS
jgi:hypothetical protein